MKIAVSACSLVEFLKDKEVISLCPEVMGGLPIPRKPAEIVDGKVKLENGASVDYEFKKGTKIALEKVIDNQVDLVILQSRSPSCGVNNIYDGTFSGKLIEGKGVFAKLLQDNNIDAIDVEDL